MGDTEDHLPGAATCSNLLLVWAAFSSSAIYDVERPQRPRYKDEMVLKKKLLSAIMSESGF